jgi:hypothetical protein
MTQRRGDAETLNHVGFRVNPAPYQVHARIYDFGREECLINTKTPTIIRMVGHHWAMSERIGGIQPRLDRRKMIPNPIRMYAPIADLDLMTSPPLAKSYQNGIKIQPKFLGSCPMGLTKIEAFSISSLFFVGWR